MAGTYVKLLTHIVFSTKRRAPFIDPRLRAELYPFIVDTVRRHGGRLLELGGMPDHVHLLVDLRPHVSVSAMVRFVKCNSSNWLHGRPDLVRQFGWQRGYGAFSVSESREAAVRSYIQNQESHHQCIPFKREITQLLARHRIDFDPDHLMD